MCEFYELFPGKSGRVYVALEDRRASGSSMQVGSCSLSS
jgi:hypothetical protein